ncbi:MULTISPECIES: DUF2089 domain-containing protein [Bacillaceae]|uniref:DUF2089 domain-containing protein n=1 Tax=Bacillus infantis TaxID=324767 RepID=A0A5D4SPF8_9BACI|nr:MULTISPECIES: DUF2089 domain-containing protein [Bacillus]OXT17902.1 hypothetical protein B9K06_08515 [Bacillus sp. OG2]MCK6206537.1 DUF2089 domain-containing protein [Bacillus infantis]MDW2876101.1 DUF2089 domain-containing protein [Bacillus infantis]PLR73222.1 DUF2089 domain-containing protein [Bacillus sp. UMB0728]TYS64244.1 DUF2089 domain-containing protein [Bacillus infantis]
MAYPLLTNCPVCTNALTITKLQCSHCQTTVENEFEVSKLAALGQEQLHFIEIFLKSRGNIKEVEKELGISYPTVRGKLDEIITALGYSTQKKPEVDKKKIVSMLEKGEISAEKAIQLLKEGE